MKTQGTERKKKIRGIWLLWLSLVLLTAGSLLGYRMYKSNDVHDMATQRADNEIIATQAENQPLNPGESVSKQEEHNATEVEAKPVEAEQEASEAEKKSVEKTTEQVADKAVMPAKDKTKKKVESQKQKADNKTKNKDRDARPKEQKKEENTSKTNDEQSSKMQNSNVTPHWIRYSSVGSSQITGEQKAYADQLVRKWTNGVLSDDELTDQLTEYFIGQGIEIHSAGIQSRQTCLFESEEEVPDYEQILKMENGFYDFAGVYTKGEIHKEGALICYYWEAGFR